MFRRLAPIVLAGVAAAALSGCGGSSRAADSDNGVTFNEVDAYIDEYRTAAEGRTLPPGREWPAEPPGEKKGRYEEGVGKGDADMIWRCTWTHEWLTQRGKAGTRDDVALAELEKFPRTFLYTTALDQVGRDWFDAGLRGAKLGDPTEFQRYAETNC